MKFGNHILRALELSEPEWAPYFVNYKLLKKRCKALACKRDSRGDSGATSNSDRAAADADSERAGVGGGGAVGGTGGGEAHEAVLLAEDNMEKAFFRTLVAEVHKASELFTTMEAQLNARLRRMEVAVGLISQKEYANTGTDYCRKLMQGCVNFYKDVLLLEDFAMTNYTAVSKCLKKHDKISGFHTREKFMANVMSKQPFSWCPHIHDMLGLVEGIFQKLEAIAPHPGRKGGAQQSAAGPRSVSCSSSTSAVLAGVDEEMRICIDAILELKSQSVTLQREEFAGSATASPHVGHVPPTDSHILNHARGMMPMLPSRRIASSVPPPEPYLYYLKAESRAGDSAISKREATATIEARRAKPVKKSKGIIGPDLHPHAHPTLQLPT